MWELDLKESWRLKNWCFWTVVLEKTLESPLDCKEIRPVHPKGNQSSIVVVRTDAEAETPILWPPDVESWLIWKDPDAGKDRRQEKGTTENEMVGWYHWLNAHESEQALGAGDGQGSLACCSPWGWKESNMTEQLNCTEYAYSKSREFCLILILELSSGPFFFFQNHKRIYSVTPENGQNFFWSWWIMLEKAQWELHEKISYWNRSVLC